MFENFPKQPIWLSAKKIQLLSHGSKLIQVVSGLLLLGTLNIKSVLTDHSVKKYTHHSKYRLDRLSSEDEK